ncbi:hypothetical protein KBD81_05415 [Candidatus Woesebacteria bacterium]|nr:hypothetical protein [Candidatus Woesebacteria bacterium]
MTPSLKDKDGTKLSVSTAVDKVSNRISQTLLEIETYILMIISWCPLWMVRYTAYRASGVRIGHDTIINFGARFYDPNNISIGSDCVIGEKITHLV